MVLIPFLVLSRLSVAVAVVAIRLAIRVMAAPVAAVALELPVALAHRGKETTAGKALFMVVAVAAVRPLLAETAAQVLPVPAVVAAQGLPHPLRELR